ncbi:MAG TPA: Gldg family protein [Rhizomicrobium sp.]|jgi:ABC-type uncharacterized transport system involved in gliding motility auxiliary subunit
MKPMPRRLYAIIAIVLAALIFVALNIAADATFTTAKLDLTENGQYTLAQGTRNIIAKVQEPILLKFYYSKKEAADYAQINAYAQRVRDLLHEYAALSGGKIIVQEIDPQPYTAEEDAASAAGLTGAPTQSGDVVYFGLVGTNSIDGKETIPFFGQDREPYLEYDLSSLIYRLSTPKKPKIAVLSGLPLQYGPGGIQAAMQGHARPFIIYQQIAQTYQTQMLEPNFTSIPSGVDVLMIVHPPTLGDPQLFAIDQFVLGGGRALVLVDPNSELAGQASGGSPFQQGGGPTSSDLPKLFQAWGVGYDPTKVVADRDLAQKVQSSDPRTPYQLYPVWLHLGSDQVSKTDQITASLQSLNLASVGALTQIKAAGTTFTPLLWSTGQSSLIDAASIRIMPQPDAIMRQIAPTGHPFTIAARISGTAKTAFAKGAPKPPTPAKGKAAAAPMHIIGQGAINVIVLADSDIFDDRFWVHVEDLYGHQVAAPFADNAAFILNSIENLSGSSDLISLRTRASSDRPFTRVKKLQAEAQAQFQQQAQNLQEHLQATQEQLRQLQAGAGAKAGNPNSAAGISAQQQREIEQFRHDLVETRTKIRDVQRNLRASVDRLGNILIFVNIVLVPLLVAFFAIGLAVLRRRRRARAIAF